MGLATTAMATVVGREGLGEGEGGNVAGGGSGGEDERAAGTAAAVGQEVVIVVVEVVERGTVATAGAGGMTRMTRR